RGRQIRGCRKYSLAQAQVGRIAGQLAHAGEEIRDFGADVSAAGGELDLRLLQGGDGGVQLPLLLRLFLNAQLQNRVPETLDFLQGDSTPKSEGAEHDRRVFNQHRAQA